MHKLVKANARRFWVTIRRDGAGTMDGWGEDAGGTVVETARKVSVTTRRGAERFESAEAVAFAPVTFGFAFEEDLVRVTDRIVHRGKTYDVKSVEEVGYREGWLADAVARAEA